MNKYRTIRVTKNGYTWYELEKRFLLFFWVCLKTSDNDIRKFETPSEITTYIKNNFSKEIRVKIK